MNFLQFAGYVNENSDRIKIHPHKCAIVTEGKHSFIHSLIGEIFI